MFQTLATADACRIVGGPASSRLPLAAGSTAGATATGRKVWNLQRTDFDLVDPTNTGLGHRGSSALAGAR